MTPQRKPLKQRGERPDNLPVAKSRKPPYAGKKSLNTHLHTHTKHTQISAFFISAQERAREHTARHMTE